MSTSSRHVLIVAIVALATVAPASAGLAAADDFVSVSADAPAFPSAETPFEVSAQLTNAEDSDSTYDLASLTVRRGENSGSEAVGSTPTGIATLRPGESLSRGVEVTLNETGSHTLYVHAVLEDGDGTERRVVQPVAVTVYDDHPQLSLATGEGSGDTRTLRVTLANGLPEEIRQVSVSLESDSVQVEDDSRVRATLGAGQEATFTFQASSANVSRHPVAVRLAYTAANGERRTVTREFSADFRPTDPSVEPPQLAVRTESAVAGAWRTLSVTLANGMTEDVRQVSLSVESASVELRESQRVTSTVAAGAERTFDFEARVDEPGSYPVTVTLEYVDSDGRLQSVSRTVQADFTAPENPGAVSLTGVSATRTGDTVSISGSAVNLGSETVSSVVVSVADASNVEPAQPQPEYFVGTVEGSDFVSFDLNARLTGNRTTVPIEFTYVVDGVTRSASTTVEAGPPPATPEDGGGGGILPAVGLGAMLVLAVGGVWWYRG
jgi:hypothetical protein